MPIDKRRESKLIAVIYADVSGAGEADAGRRLRPALERLNQLFAPAVAEPFAVDRRRSRRRRPGRPCAGAALHQRAAREPGPTRAAASAWASARWSTCATRRPPGATSTPSPVRALQLAVRDGGLCRYLGTGEAGDVLLGALCRLVDPLIRARTQKQWEAIAAYRELGHQRDVAERLGVTRQSVGDRLAAGHRRAVEEADAAVATYLSYFRRQRFTP